MNQGKVFRDIFAAHCPKSVVRVGKAGAQQSAKLDSAVYYESEPSGRDTSGSVCVGLHEEIFLGFASRDFPDYAICFLFFTKPCIMRTKCKIFMHKLCTPPCCKHGI